MAKLVHKTERGSRSDPFADPFAKIRDFFLGDPFREPENWFGHSGRTFAPDTEVKETKDAYVFKIDLPGVDEKDITVSATGDQVTISGKREEEKVEEGTRYHAHERSYGEFTRMFTLPIGTDADHMEAMFENGVLAITMPKTEVQTKRIAIRSSKQLDGKEGKKAA